MASIFTPAKATIDPATDEALVAAVITPHECASCRSLIVLGQRWVREKIYDRPRTTARTIAATTLTFSSMKN